MAAQLPVRNIANIQAAVSGTIAQGNNIAQDIQAYNAHQQQLATITQQRVDEMAMMSAQ